MIFGVRLGFLAALMASFLAVTLPAQDSEIAKQTFRVGSQFLSKPETTENVQETFAKELGIEFPNGTYIAYDRRDGTLRIQHQPGVIAAIKAYLEALNPGEKSISIRAEIYQLPALAALKLQQFCGPLDNHDAARQNVMKMVERGEASFVVAAPVLVRSGQRARASQIDEVIYQTEIDWDDDDETIVPAAFETRNVGTDFEVDPVLGPDDFTIDMNFNLEHHSAPPTMRPITVTSPKTGRKVVTEFPEFHAKKIITQIVTTDGCIKLIGAWRPTGKPEFEKADLMQIAFLKADVVTKETVVPVGSDAESK